MQIKTFTSVVRSKALVLLPKAKISSARMQKANITILFSGHSFAFDL